MLVQSRCRRPVPLQITPKKISYWHESSQSQRTAQYLTGEENVKLHIICLPHGTLERTVEACHLCSCLYIPLYVSGLLHSANNATQMGRAAFKAVLCKLIQPLLAPFVRNLSKGRPQTVSHQPRADLLSRSRSWRWTHTLCATPDRDAVGVPQC